MKQIVLLYGGALSLGWGRAQNLAREIARMGNNIYYVDEIRPPGRRFPMCISPEGVLQVRSAPGLPDVRVPPLALPHALLQLAWIGWRPSLRSADLLIVYGVPNRWLQKILLPWLAPKASLYDCADDKEATFRDLVSPAAGEAIARSEASLVQRVDRLSAINESNLRRLDPNHSKPSRVIPNGVDIDLFHFRSRNLSKKKTLRLIYAGAVNDRIDVEKIQAMLDAQPGRLELHIYGGDHPSMAPLKGREDVRFHGYIHYRDLPSAFDVCDIGLLPYRDIESIRKSSPLKSLQYLSAGLPVAAFPYQGIETFGGLVHLIDPLVPQDAVQWSVPDNSLAKAHSWAASARALLEFAC